MSVERITGKVSMSVGSLPVPNVQSLAAGLAKIPKRYIRPEIVSEPVFLDAHLEIPTIDFGRLLDPNLSQQESAKLHLACQEWGFFQLTNHNIPSEVVEELKADITDFFELPLEEKKVFGQLPGSLEGYGQLFVVSDDQKLDWSDMIYLHTLPLARRSTDLWPTQPRTFRDTLESYSTELYLLAKVLLGLMASNLGTNPEIITSMLTQAVRINYYPPCPEADKVLGFTPHSDGSLITLVLQANQVQGLQIKKNGGWVPVKPLPGAFVVNIGDSLEILSNGKYRSIEHRAVVNKEKERLSIAAFHSSNPDSMIGPLPDIAREDEANYKTLNYEDFSKLFFSSKLEGKSSLDRMKLNRDRSCMYIKPVTGVEAASKLVHIFVERSIQAAYKRILGLLDNTSEREVRHPLATLANELKLVAETELASFIPVSCRHYPEAGAVSSLALHQLYGQQLKPYLEGISSISESVHISESVRSVLAAANSLELCLTDILNLVCGDGMESPISSYFHPYQIWDVCTPLILHWVNSQHDNMLEWTKHVIQLEGWEPLSSQQRQAAIVEVFRIIEETVDQFFDIHLPMDIIHLRSLLIGIFHSLDAYLLHLVNQQVDRSILYPRPPALTRYKESLNPFMRKKTVEGLVVEEKVIDQLDNLTVSKLCVKLNSVYYIRDQLDTLEDSIQQSWVSVQSVSHHNSTIVLEELSASSESIVELFSIFDDIRRSVIDASNVILDFIGTRVIFWDMRDSFLSSLYRSSVENARVENLVPELDQVLDCLCDLIIDILRDRVVLSICQASMDGYVWVMLDGGPSRAFAEEDVAMMQEDLNILKELFIANGQGLPSDEVEKESRLAQQILDLYALKTQTIIEMLLSASEHVLFQPDPNKSRSRSAKDADTLLRILCHKKDNTASEFLKLHFELPKSSDYDEALEMEPSGIFKRNTSFSWTERGQRSFSMMKKKIQEARF